MAIILITGGSGLIGTALTARLLEQGHEVRHLSRSAGGSRVRTYQWDPAAGKMDDAALIGVDHIVHLAGAGIADERWTKKRVDVLIKSRTVTSDLLLQRYKNGGRGLQSFISAAGIGYYGAFTSDLILKEDHPPGRDTIGMISREWEHAVDRWTDITRVVKLRTAVVLAADGGALPQLARPVRMAVGAPLGSGDQWMPWVHLEDLVGIYARAIDDKRMKGAFNASAGAATNREMMSTIATVLDRPFFLPAVPAFAMQIALGEMADVLLKGSRVDNGHLLAQGFSFKHPVLKEALRDLLANKDQ